MFASALGLQREDWSYLRDEIRRKLPNSDATRVRDSDWGPEWEVPILVQGRNTNRRYVVTSWISEWGTRPPRLTSCYLEKSSRNRALRAREDDP